MAQDNAAIVRRFAEEVKPRGEIERAGEFAWEDVVGTLTARGSGAVRAPASAASREAGAHGRAKVRRRTCAVVVCRSERKFGEEPAAGLKPRPDFEALHSTG
jgi:hypothetical protein